MNNLIKCLKLIKRLFELFGIIIYSVLGIGFIILLSPIIFIVWLLTPMDEW